MLSPARLVEPVRLQDRILSLSITPWAPGWTLGSAAAVLRELGRNVRNGAHTFLPQLHLHKEPISIFHSQVFFLCGVKLKLCCHLPASVLFIGNRAKPGLVGLDHSSCRLSQLSLLQLATETVKSKSLGSSKHLKQTPQVYLYIITSFYSFFA